MAAPLLALIPLVDRIIDKVFPDPEKAASAKLEMLKLTQASADKELDAAVQMATGQMKVNEAEAASEGWYKGGWRPAIGYVGAFCLLYNYVGNPLLIWGCALWAPDVVPPNLPIDDHMWELIFGLVGLGGWRTLDKRSAIKSGQ